MTGVSAGKDRLPALQPSTTTTALFTLAGLGAAFGLAACCALPMLLISLGLGTAWLGGIATVAVPNRNLLLGFAVIALSGGAVLLWRQQRHAANCGPDGVCTPPAVRVLTLVGLIVGVALLIAGYLYA